MADNYFSTVKQRAKEVRFKKWSVIIARGSPIEAIFVLERGKLVQHDGDADQLRELGESEVDCPERVTPGEHFGVECLTDRRARAPYTLVALTDVQLLRVPPEAVWSVLQEERHHLDRIPLLSQEVLSKAEQYMLVAKLKAWNFPSGRNIINEGEIGDMLFVIEKGVCDAIKEVDGREVVVSQLKKGSFFGELAVMYDMPRNATVRAATDVVAVSLSREDLFSTVGPEGIEKMRVVARSQVFGNVPLLGNLPTAQKISVAANLQSDAFQEGAVIVEEGRPTSRLYILEEGEVRLTSAAGWESVLVAGQSFGTQGLLYGAPHDVTATAVSDGAKTWSISLEGILSTARTGERPMVERNLRDSTRMQLLRAIPQLNRLADGCFPSTLR